MIVAWVLGNVLFNAYERHVPPIRRLLKLLVLIGLVCLRTSSAANIGADKDSEKRQRAAIEAFAKRAGFEIIDWYYDAAVSGADRIEHRPVSISPSTSPASLNARSLLRMRVGSLTT